MKIAFYGLREFDELIFVKKFSAQFGIDYVWSPDFLNDDNISLAEGCQGICTTPCVMTEKWIDKLHEMGITFISCRSIGYDHLPVDYMSKYNMKVTNSPYPPNCVANYAIMLILMATRKMNECMTRAKIQDFTLNGKMGRDIGDLTVGVIGTGNIGSTVIKHLSGFGCRILAHSRRENEEVKQYAEYVDLDTLYAESDVITLHMASNNSTAHLINAEAIRKMKDGVIIVNTARGTLIDSEALIAALKSGKIGGAALDVYEKENGLFYHDLKNEIIDNDYMNILRSFPNVICSPHFAFYVETTVSNMVEKAFISAAAYEKGEKSPFQVN